MPRSSWFSAVLCISYSTLISVQAGLLIAADLELSEDYPWQTETISPDVSTSPASPTSPGSPASPDRAAQLSPTVAGVQETALPLDFDEASTHESFVRFLISDSPAAKPDDSATVAPSGPGSSSAAIELTPELLVLRDKVRQVLTMYAPRHQNTRDNSPWEVMHAIIAHGVDTQLFKDGPGGEKVNAVGWMCYNHPCKGDQILFVNRGKIDARRGPGVQGHFGQFLAILAQSHVKIDYPMYVSGKSFTLADLVEHEKENCVAGEELTFKLIALMHYLDSDSTWTTRDGQQWSLQRLVQEELKQPIRGAACGGTHRLMGFSYAVNKRLQRGKPIVGEFQRAQAFLQDYHRYTLSLQNPDGSFSTEWFTRRGDNPDIDRRLKTSGHILEWISFSLSDQELRDPRMVKAVDYVATILLKNGQHKWEVGPLGHGLHSLAIYDNRVFKPADPQQAQAIVEHLQDSAAGALEARRADVVAE